MKTNYMLLLSIALILNVTSCDGGGNNDGVPKIEIGGGNIDEGGGGYTDASNACESIINKVSSCLSEIELELCAGYSQCHAYIKPDAQERCEEIIEEALADGDFTSSEFNDEINMFLGTSCYELADTVGPYTDIEYMKLRATHDDSTHLDDIILDLLDSPAPGSR